MSKPVLREPLGLGVEVIARHRFKDHRGTFSELWNRVEFTNVGLDFDPQQVSVSRSSRGVLRGLHIQHPYQLKFVTVLSGHTFHVGVDLRPESQTFGKHVSIELKAEESRGVLFPKGFAHGFVALEDSQICYLCDEVHEQSSDWSIKWCDPQLALSWPISEPILSERDRKAMTFQDYANLKVQPA